MTLNLTGKRCGDVLARETEGELVARVPDHVRRHARDHGTDHFPTREQILVRLAREQTNHAGSRTARALAPVVGNAGGMVVLQSHACLQDVKDGREL